MLRELKKIKELPGLSWISQCSFWNHPDLRLYFSFHTPLNQFPHCLGRGVKSVHSQRLSGVCDSQGSLRDRKQGAGVD